MHLVITRTEKTTRATFGELSIDGKFFCYTLEDPVRDVKIPKETAIPAGAYKVVLSMSNRFKKVLPEVLNVPGFVGVRIHGGNTVQDTEGCPLVGYQRTSVGLSSSLPASTDLVKRLSEAKDTIWLTVG